MARRLTPFEEELADDLRRLLAQDREIAAQALLELYDLQTEEEKAGEHPDIHNGVGFSLYDSDILSDFARQLRAGFALSPRQWRIIHDKLPKYAGQLVRLGLVFEKGEAA